VINVLQGQGGIASVIRDWNLPCAILVDGEEAMEEV